MRISESDRLHKVTRNSARNFFTVVLTAAVTTVAMVCTALAHDPGGLDSASAFQPTEVAPQSRAPRSGDLGAIHEEARRAAIHRQDITRFQAAVIRLYPEIQNQKFENIRREFGSVRGCGWGTGSCRDVPATFVYGMTASYSCKAWASETHGTRGWQNYPQYASSELGVECFSL